MKKTNNSLSLKARIEYRQHILLAVILFGMSMVAGIGNRVNMSTVLSFAGFQICCILIPGTMLFDGFPIEGITDIERVLLSYAVGYSLNIICYFVTYLLNIYNSLQGIYILVFAVSTVVIVVRKDRYVKENQENQASDYVWIWLIAILFVVSFITFSCRYALPTYIEGNSYFNDLFFWAGDAVELNKEFPPADFRTLQPNYRYHYFSALQLAVVSRVTGIAVARVAFTYSFIQAAVLMGLSAYCLTVRMIRNSKVRVITLLLLFFSTGFEKIILVTYFWHIYFLPMGFNTAYAFEMTIALLLIIQMKEDKVSSSNVIWMMIFFAICTGLKGPVGTVIMVGIGVSCLQWLCKKEYKKAFGYGIAALCTFAMMYFLFMQGALKNYDTHVKTTQTIQTANETVQTDQMVQRVQDGIDGKINRMLRFIGYSILLNPWTVWAAFIYVCICSLLKTIKKDEIMFSSMILIGISLGYFIVMNGHSEAYFSVSIFCFTAILAGKGIEKIAEVGAMYLVDNKVKMWICKSFMALFVICMIMFSYKFSYYKDTVSGGMTNLIGRTSSDVIEDGISKKEYEAYDWIRTNTEEMALLLCDRQLEGDMFASGVFSERHVYYCLHSEEVDEARKVFQGEEEYLQKFIDKGIDYIVQTKRFSPNFTVGEERCKKVFENTDTVVWQVIN